MAKNFLAEEFNYRSLKKPKVIQFAKDITNGKWALTYDTFKIDTNGKPVDCQHRCHAIILADKPIETLIVYNVPEKIYPFIDTGSTRSGGDTLQISGVENSIIIAAAITKLEALKRGLSVENEAKRSSLTNRIILELEIKYRQEIAIYYPLASSLYARSRLITKSYILAIMLYLSLEKHHPYEKIESFFTQLMTGVNLENNVLGLLRDKLILDMSTQRKMTTYVKQALISKTWNFYLKGVEPKILKFDSVRDNYIDFK
jgi:hypothetical protein